MSIPFPEHIPTDLDLYNDILDELDQGLSITDLETSISRTSGPGSVQNIVSGGQKLSQIRQALDHYIRRNLLGRFLNNVTHRSVNPTTLSSNTVAQIWRLLGKPEEQNTSGENRQNAPQQKDLDTTRAFVNINSEALPPKKVNELAQDCVKGFLTERRADKALSDIGIYPAQIGSRDTGLYYFIEVIKYLCGRQDSSGNSLLIKWLNELTKDEIEPEKTNPNHFAKKWLTQFSPVANENDRQKIETVREAFLFAGDMLHSVRWFLDAFSEIKKVCHIRFTDDTSGSGFLVAPDLIMTNCHVIKTSNGKGKLRTIRNILFDDFRDENDKVNPAITTGKIIYSYMSDNEEVDIALIEIPKVTDRTPVRLLESPEIKQNNRIYIPQHSQGRDMTIGLVNNQIKQDCQGDLIQHTSPTEKGASGSPIFDQSWKVIGIHWGGNEQKRSNYGTNMKSVLSLIKKHEPEIYDKLTVI